MLRALWWSAACEAAAARAVRAGMAWEWRRGEVEDVESWVSKGVEMVVK